MKTLQAITTVYSYYLPEVRELITDLTRPYPHDVFLRSISPGLDDFHEPIIDQLVDFHRHDVPHLAEFDYRYPTAGSEEGIREYMTLLQSRGVKEVYVWKGDYEGYGEVAASRGIRAIKVDYDADPSTLRPGHWFLSNPSARDGMIVPEEKITAIAEAGHRVFYDLSYLGATDPHTFDLDHPNVAAAAISFSKPYGLFYYRVGFTLTRDPIPALYANKWFKNVFGLLIAQRILDTLDPQQVAAKYKGIQAEIVEQIREETGLGILPSDAFLLARMPVEETPPDQQGALARFRRDDGYRFCLTPYFLAHEGAAGDTS